jgi:hypothetical protein
MSRPPTNRPAAVLLGLLAVAACRTTQAPLDDRTHAVRPTPEGRDAIAQVASREFAGARAVLDEDAIADDGVRVVAPSSDPGRAERFHLSRTGERCVLIHDRTDRRYELTDTACAPR